jgi:hypothetical protein
MAFDVLHRLRHARPLPSRKLRLLAALLDVGAWANAVFDDKERRRHECRDTMQALTEASIRSSVAEYLRRLGNLESRRPLPGGDYGRFREVALYREAVVRLSLGLVATAADCSDCLDEGIRATCRDADLDILFRISMQCQIIDDVLDYSRDMSAGLPSFLTASRSVQQAFELTRLAATGYADQHDLPRTAALFPLRAALFLVSICTTIIVVLGHWRQRTQVGQQFAAGRLRTSPRPGNM